MDYNSGLPFTSSGEGYVSFVDPADDTWIERHLEEANYWPGLSRAANRRPLPQNLFCTLPEPTNQSRVYLQERANRRAILENVFLGQPLQANDFNVPTLPVTSRYECQSRQHNLFSKVCLNCGYTKMAKLKGKRSWSRSDVNMYGSGRELAIIRGKFTFMK